MGAKMLSTRHEGVRYADEVDDGEAQNAAAQCRQSGQAGRSAPGAALVVADSPSERLLGRRERFSSGRDVSDLICGLPARRPDFGGSWVDQDSDF
jgi:hypothetical protein